MIGLDVCCYVIFEIVNFCELMVLMWREILLFLDVLWFNCNVVIGVVFLFVCNVMVFVSVVLFFKLMFMVILKLFEEVILKFIVCVWVLRGCCDIFEIC